ncbi:MAG: phage shock protein PspA [Deltaproteobacteria bacterium]|nr:phage shock protein PspA [Deltaproteobacteria bacterium]
MGIFTRFRDIISSNINAMLDRAEDPEKLIKLMIREMEDTLVEIKASCAGVMASMKKIQRQLDEVQSRIEYWEERAALAARKGRDDLAREALLEKRRYDERAGVLEEELSEHSLLVEQYQEDIGQLEDKLGSAREKQRMLQQRHIHARRKMRAQEDIRRMETSDAIFKFEEFENRIERMEAEADLVNFGRKQTLEGELDSLLVDDDIEKELQRIKSSFANKNEEAPSEVVRV